jgi:hypothetical protein
MNVQRLESEDTSPITSPRAPATLPKETQPKTHGNKTMWKLVFYGTVISNPKED